LISSDSLDWLTNEARRQLFGCRKIAADGTVLYTPDGTGQYDALWTRDFGYMVENAFDFIPQDHIQSAISYLLNGQRDDGCIPDRIYADGQVVYCAGPVGQPVAAPPLDNSQFMVKLVADFVRGSGDVDFFNEISAQLIRAMNYVPRSANGLVYNNPQQPHSPYGFTDTIAKTGELLFSSLLHWEACQRLVELFEKLHDQKSARDFQKQAFLIEENLDTLWSEEDGMFLAASMDCHQIDIWGNAYAIYIDFPLGAKRDQIMAYLERKFDNYVMKGQIRHLPRPEYWERTLIPIEPETYQNGAYWGTASGWIAFALFEKHPELSRTIMTDLIADYQQHSAHECINNDYAKIKNYVVSVVNPLGAICKQKNVIPELQVTDRSLEAGTVRKYQIVERPVSNTVLQ